MRQYLLTWLLAIPSISCSSVLVIGHRGASGHRPEHTRASYELAIEMGADFIEPDLVMTRDHVLIARHENEISQTTDVATKFPNKKTRKTIDGETVEGWFTEDFTLAEIKTLKARERLPFRDHSFDGQFEVLTFQEVLAIAQTRNVGIYPELKHPTYFANIGMDVEAALLSDLRKVGWAQVDSPVVVQSFELSSLRKIRESSNLKLTFLLDEAGKRPFDHVTQGDPRTYGDLMRPSELKQMAKVITGIGPWKRLILPESPTGDLMPPTSLVQDAHAAGLKVHVYTFRSDSRFLHTFYKGDALEEYRQFRRLGIDGVFTDFPDHALRALRP